MASILNNVSALGASRQLGITAHGLQQTIERLTTGKRINRASDDAAGMAQASTAEAAARNAKESVRGYQTAFFNAQALDGYMEEASNQALRLAELEGSSNTTSAEYTAVQTLVVNASTQGGTAVAATNATTALAAIATARATLASTMATAHSNANIAGIRAEGQFAVSDSIQGADIGAEMVNLTKYQILMQAGTSALSNANQSSQTVLGLFR